MGIDNIRIDYLENCEEAMARWDNYVESHSLATIYHHRRWRQIFEHSFGYQSWYMVAYEDEKMVGCLPVFLVKSPFCRRLVSVPFRDRGGVLWDSPSALAEILAEMTRLADRLRAVSVEIKSLVPYPPEVLEKAGFQERFYWVNSRVDLKDLDIDGYWDKLDTKTRNMIRQAQRAGLIFENVAFSQNSIRTWFALHLATQKRLGLPPFPFKYFQSMMRELTNLGAAKMFLVRQGNRNLAATLILLNRDTGIYGYASSHAAAAPLRSNDFMLFNVIKWLLENGYKEFDLGSDSPVQKGLLFFKRKWRAQQTVIPVYTFGRTDSFGTDSSSPRYQLLRRIFRHLPLGVSRLIGRVAVKYFG